MLEWWAGRLGCLGSGIHFCDKVAPQIRVFRFKHLTLRYTFSAGLYSLRQIFLRLGG